MFVFTFLSHFMSLSRIISDTVNPLYNDFRYISKFVITSILSESCTFFIDSPMLFFRKTYVLDIC